MMVCVRVMYTSKITSSNCINKKHIDLVLKTFNSYNNKLQFTYELE